MRPEGHRRAAALAEPAGAREDDAAQVPRSPGRSACPRSRPTEGARLRVIAGESGGRAAVGPVEGLAVAPKFVDVTLPARHGVPRAGGAGPHGLRVPRSRRRRLRAGAQAVHASRARHLRRGRPRGGAAAGRRRRALPARGRPPARRADRALRAVRDEHARGDRADAGGSPRAAASSARSRTTRDRVRGWASGAPAPSRPPGVRNRPSRPPCRRALSAGDGGGRSAGRIRRPPGSLPQLGKGVGAPGERCVSREPSGRVIVTRWAQRPRHRVRRTSHPLRSSSVSRHMLRRRR